MSIVISGNKNLKFIKAVYYQPPQKPLFPMRLYTTKVDDRNYTIYNEDTIRLLDYFEQNAVFDGYNHDLYLEPGQLYINDIEILEISGRHDQFYWSEAFFEILMTLPGVSDNTMWYTEDDSPYQYKRGTIHFHMEK